MGISLCQRFGFDDETIQKRLASIGLGRGVCARNAGALHELVVQPSADRIVDDLVAELSEDPFFLDIVRKHSQPERLKAMLKSYLLSLGHECCSAEYFERRLHVGVVHKHADVSLSRYQSAFGLLQSMLIHNIPDSVKQDPEAFEAMVQFILKITTLDMSLAIETFHSDKLADVEVLLKTDSLTGVHSRQNALMELERRLHKSKAHRTTLCAIMADLDRFKSVNDNHGHLAGDETLRVAARRMSAAARENDVIGRYGGEEFLVILEDTTIEAALHLAERMRESICSDPIHVHDQRVSITVSIGVAEAREDDDAGSLLQRADRLLYAAKAEGRNRVRA